MGRVPGVASPGAHFRPKQRPGVPIVLASRPVISRFWLPGDVCPLSATVAIPAYARQHGCLVFGFRLFPRGHSPRSTSERLAYHGRRITAPPSYGSATRAKVCECVHRLMTYAYRAFGLHVAMVCVHTRTGWVSHARGAPQRLCPPHECATAVPFLRLTVLLAASRRVLPNDRQPKSSTGI